MASRQIFIRKTPENIIIDIEDRDGMNFDSYSFCKIEKVWCGGSLLGIRNKVPVQVVRKALLFFLEKKYSLIVLNTCDGPPHKGSKKDRPGKPLSRERAAACQLAAWQALCHQVNQQAQKGSK